MPSEYSNVHRQPSYWNVRFDQATGWEAPHIHAFQGEREIQIYTDTLEVKNQNGRFTNDEIDELKQIARSYRSNYCLEINESDFLDNEINGFPLLQQFLLDYMNDETKYSR